MIMPILASKGYSEDLGPSREDGRKNVTPKCKTNLSDALGGESATAPMNRHKTDLVVHKETRGGHTSVSLFLVKQLVLLVLEELHLCRSFQRTAVHSKPESHARQHATLSDGASSNES